MIKIISFNLATTIMIILLSSAIIFHLLIIFQFIPYHIVWGGRVETLSQMYQFEAISIGINLLMIFTVFWKCYCVKIKKSSKILDALLWILIGIFVLNTIGNLFAKSSLETTIFTPLTFISAILLYRIVIEKIER